MLALFTAIFLRIVMRISLVKVKISDISGYSCGIERTLLYPYSGSLLKRIKSDKIQLGEPQDVQHKNK